MSTTASTASSRRKRTAKAAGAIVLALALALSGTFAYTAFSTYALNEAKTTINPGGRLHDEFYLKAIADKGDGIYSKADNTKDIYVENFSNAGTGAAIYARVRLYEYMEIGDGAGEKGTVSGETVTPSDDNKATSLDTANTAAKLEKQDTWTVHNYKSGDIFDRYWNWTYGGTLGDKWIPTENTATDGENALKADIVGTLAGKDGKPYGDYIPTADRTAVADPHNAMPTATVKTMTEWVADGSEAGDFWVYDDTVDSGNGSGWFYYANPIMPGQTSGLLLNAVELGTTVGASWYYGINVEGQFASANNWGNSGGYYFGDKSAEGNRGTASQKAIDLLNKAMEVENTGNGFGNYVVSVQGGASNTGEVPAGTSIASIASATRNDSPATATFTYRLAEEVEGVTLNANNGILTVADTVAEDTEITVVATTTSTVPASSAEYTVKVVEASDWKTALANALPAYKVNNASNLGALSKVKVGTDENAFEVYKLEQEGASSLVLVKDGISLPTGTESILAWQWGSTNERSARNWCNSTGYYSGDEDNSRPESGYLPSLPDDVRAALRTVNIRTPLSYDDKFGSVTTSDKVFFLSAEDIFNRGFDSTIVNSNVADRFVTPTNPTFYTVANKSEGNTWMVPDAFRYLSAESQIYPTRTPISDSTTDQVATVHYNGTFTYGSETWWISAVRPSMWLNTSD